MENIIFEDMVKFLKEKQSDYPNVHFRNYDSVNKCSSIAFVCKEEGQFVKCIVLTPIGDSARSVNVVGVITGVFTLPHVIVKLDSIKSRHTTGGENTFALFNKFFREYIKWQTICKTQLTFNFEPIES